MRDTVTPLCLVLSLSKPCISCCRQLHTSHLRWLLLFSLFLSCHLYIICDELDSDMRFHLNQTTINLNPSVRLFFRVEIRYIMKCIFFYINCNFPKNRSYSHFFIFYLSIFQFSEFVRISNEISMH